MLHGGSVKIIPSWVPQTTQIDIQWDDTKLSGPQPKGKWWGDLALLARTSSNEGGWEWKAAAKEGSGSTGPRLPTFGRMARAVHISADPGNDGNWQLMPGLAPAIGDLILTWRF